jgi:hypothetical protein
VVRPAGQRSLAGFTVGEHLARQVYGDLYRATGDGRRDARLLIVDPALVAEPAFAEALSSGRRPCSAPSSTGRWSAPWWWPATARTW